MTEDPADPERAGPTDGGRPGPHADPVLGPFLQDLDRELERIREPVARLFERLSSRRAPLAAPRGPEPRLPGEVPSDVHLGPEAIAVTADLAAAGRPDVEVRARERELVLVLGREPDRRTERIELPARIRPGSARATLANGVLDVEADRGPADGDEARVPIE